MECTFTKDTLTIKIPLQKTLKASKPPVKPDAAGRMFRTGKNLLLANSGGFREIDADYKGETVKVNVCALIPNPDFEGSVIDDKVEA